MDPLIWQLLLQVVLIFFNAVFACAEIAVLSVSDNKIAQLAEKGDKRAVRLAALTSEPARFLATIQVAITLSGFLGSAFAADKFASKIVDLVVGMGVNIPASIINSISVILITLILSYFTLVFGELVPKRLAMKNAEKLALGMSAMITAISKLFSPIVWLLTKSTNGMLRLLRVDPNAEEENVSEEELLLMVDAGRKKGVFDLEESDFIENVFEFDDVTASEFATHRTEVSILWTDESTEEWEATIAKSRHTLYPVCDESVDNVVGVLNVRDYFLLKEKNHDNIYKYAIKPAYFVPETVCADVLFRQMKATHNHFAVILDEYGGMYGIVTVNDLVELLVGDLDDCSDCEIEPPEIERLGEDLWKIRGTAPLSDVAKELDIELSLDEDYDTFGGLVFDNYGSVPDDGTEIEINIGVLRIKVTEIKQHRIEKALVSVDRDAIHKPEEDKNSSSESK